MQPDQVTERPGEDSLTVPPPGFSAIVVARSAGMVLCAAVALLAGVKVFAGSAWTAPRVVAGLGSLLLLATAAYILCHAALDRTIVCFAPRVLRVTHTFPWPRTTVIGREDCRAVVIGCPGLIRRGYFRQHWKGRELEVVVVGADRVAHFGGGLSAEQKARVKERIQKRLAPPGTGGAEAAEHGERLLQPPELRWRRITRWAAFVLLALVAGLVFSLALGFAPATLGWVALAVVASGTVAALGYRKYRSSRAAGRWHRALAGSLARSMGLSFSPTDAALKNRELPDFAFFGGPRRLYNVGWSRDASDALIAFHYSSAGPWLPRDGVGCALAVEGLSAESISIRPFRTEIPLLWWRCMKMGEFPELADHYCVRAENEGRARALLGSEVVAVLDAWGGEGPRPWVCVDGGMVGVSLPRSHAADQRTLRELCAYGRRLHRVVEERLQALRNERSEGPSR